MTAEQLAESIILKSKNWDPYRDRVKPWLLRGMIWMFAERIKDFHSMLHYKTAYSELMKSDAGMVKLARILPDALGIEAIRARYQHALSHGEPFAEELRDALSGKTKELHGAVVIGPKAFLYLNWYSPWQFPSLEHGLVISTNKELVEWIEPHQSWDEGRVKTELNLLGLNRETDKAGNVPISWFLHG